MPKFIHLRVKSTYSLLEGAMRIKPLVELAVKNKMPALALSDNNNMFASLDFSQVAASSGVQPIIACCLNFASLDYDNRHHASLNTCDRLLLLAKDETGYLNLIKLCSKAWVDPEAGNAPQLKYDDLKEHTQGLIALTSGQYGSVGKRLLHGHKEAASDALKMLEELFPGNLYIELMRHGLPEEEQIEAGLIALANEHNLPLVATNDIHFSTPDMYEAHDALMCIAEGRYVSEAERKRLTPEHRFKSQDEMCELFADIPEAIENTVNIAKRCGVMSPSRNPILPRFADDEAESLRQQGRQGLQERMQTHVFKDAMSEDQKTEIAKPYFERLEFELNVIIKMQFPGYFLIVSDFIRWSKENGIPVGPGRGSGAGSVVAWALQITDLDPLKYGLLFERFLNPERVSMPDFDVDFCQDRRDEVIAYVREKYGKDRVAQIITFGKLQARAVLRDVGRVLQLPYNQVDNICKLVPNNPAAPVTLEQAINIEPALKDAIEDDEAVARMVGISLKLEGLNRHASTHAAGVVIGDRPLDQLVPLYRDAKSDMLVVQYSMKYAEAAGLVKFDFLGLKTLTVLQKAVELVATAKGTKIDLLKLPEGDKKTYAMLGSGDTIGVFQLESTGMRDTLKRLKPDCLEDIIALVSLYRPGPMDNIPTYIARKHGSEKPEYLHPKLEAVLKETFGVIIYQEQVMQIAQLLAGYSLGEADLLRRAMGKKIRAEMEAQRDIFVERSVANGVEKAQASSIFDLIAKFAEYGFNKSHAAAYALIAYQTAYMKANYPVEFLAASMTYDMHNTDKLVIFREEAMRSGIKMLPPDINKSGVYFLPEGDNAIRYALAAIRNVGDAAMKLFIDERQNGEFKDIWDMAARLPTAAINRRQLEFLIKAGAFDNLHKNRNQLSSSLDSVVAYNNAIAREKESLQSNLFASFDDTRSAPPHPTMPICDDFSPTERMDHENDALGFYLSSHPIFAYRGALQRLGVVQSQNFSSRLGSAYAPMRVAGLVSKIKIRSSEKGRFAFVTISDEGGVFEISIFKEDILNRYRPQLEGGSLIVAQVDGKREEGGARLIMQSMQPLDEAILSVQSLAMPKHYAITLNSSLPLDKIRNILGEANGAGCQITLRAKLDADRFAEIELPGKYQLTPEKIMQIPVFEGVVECG